MFFMKIFSETDCIIMTLHCILVAIMFVTNGAPDLDCMPAISQIFPISTTLFAYPTSVYVIGNFVDINHLVQMSCAIICVFMHMNTPSPHQYLNCYCRSHKPVTTIDIAWFIEWHYATLIKWGALLNMNLHMIPPPDIIGAGRWVCVWRLW